MKKNGLFALWAGLYILCAGLGFVPEAGGALRGVLTGAAAVFFLPPSVLLYRAGRDGDRHTLQLIRNLSALSLGLTLVVLVANFALAVRSEWLGTVLHYVLVVVSSPMICSGYWVMSLFLWACLLMAAMKLLRK